MLGVQGWRSSESTRLPPMCPGFDSLTRRYMAFLRALRFPPSTKTNTPNSNSICAFHHQVMLECALQVLSIFLLFLFMGSPKRYFRALSEAGKGDVQFWRLTQLPRFCFLMVTFFGLNLFSENATMSFWSPFTTCSASCGGGRKTRHRTCNRSRFGGNNCSALGPLTEQQPCNVHDCNGKPFLLNLECAQV